MAMADEPLARLDPHRFPAPRERRARQRETDALHDDVQRYALDAHVPRVRHLLDRIDRRGRERDLQELIDVITPFVAFHERDYPFAVAPPGTLDRCQYTTPFRQLADGQRITYDADLGTRHVLLAGPTGEGKSMASAGIVRCARDSDPDTHIVLVDAKRELHGLAARDHDFLLLDRSVELNLIVPDDALTLPALIDVNIDVGKQCLYAGAAYASIAQQAYERTYARGPHASTLDFIDEVDALASKGETYAYRDSQRNTSARHRRAARSYPHLHVRGAPGIAALWGRSIYLPLAGTSDIDDFHATYLVRRLFHYAQAHPAPGSLRYIIDLDEGQPFFSDNPNTITGRASLSIIQGMSRSTGIAFCVNTNALALTDASLRGNVATMIFFRPANGVDAHEVQRTLNLTDNQVRYACAMPRGHVIIKIAHWPQAILATFDPIDLGTTPAEYQQAIERTRAYFSAHATTQPPALHRAAREGIEGTGQPTPSHAPSSSPPSRVAPVVEHTADTRRIALNKHVASLLHDAWAHPYSLCTVSYRRCGLRLSEGDRARSQAERLQLLHASRVTCGRGRGKTGICLSLTDDGLRWLGRTPTKGLRGGSSVQHCFCVFELHRRIPGSSIEEYLDTKAVDLCIPFNTHHHEGLYRTIVALTGMTPRLNDGAMIAVEVEITGGARSAQRNAAKNQAAGVALTIIAIDHKAPERLAARLPGNTLVVDVYALLDALRTTENA